MERTAESGSEVLTSAGPTPIQAVAKRALDLVGSGVGLLLTGWIIAIAYVAARIDTGESGFFTQERVGRDGARFRLIKIRTMRSDPSVDTMVTTSADPRLTRLGRFLRKAKLDELPQLFNVLVGQMSFVGPRPDVPGYADRLTGEDRVILTMRPGITGPATLRYRDEEEVLASVEDPERYNREVIFPDKVRLNVDYVRNFSLRRDLEIILRTILGR